MAKFLPSALLLLCTSYFAGAQSTSTAVNDSVAKKHTYHQVVRKKPEYPGGLQAFHNYLIEKLEPLGYVKNLKGKMLLTFIIEKDGSVTNVKIVKGIEKELNLAVIDILKGGPRWTPATNDGKLIRAQYSLPIVFDYPKAFLSTASDTSALVSSSLWCSKKITCLSCAAFTR